MGQRRSPFSYTARMRQHPTLTTKLMATGCAFLFLAMVSIGLTLWVTWKLEGGAAAVNEAGRLRMYTVRMALAPEIPTVVEAGYPKLLAENFLGLTGPAGLPRDIADKVHKAAAEVLARPDIVKRLEDMGVALQKMSSAEFTDFVTKQVAEWGPAVKASGAKLN